MTNEEPCDFARHIVDLVCSKIIFFPFVSPIAHTNTDTHVHTHTHTQCSVFILFIMSVKRRKREVPRSVQGHPEVIH